MKKGFAWLAGAFLLSVCGATFGTLKSVASPVTLRIFDGVTFYDGYRMGNFPEDATTDDGVLRHLTSLYAVRLTDDDIAQIGDSLKMNVFVEACCDNYDRIGNINLALVPKGSETYTTSDPDVKRLEIARFITPFMNKNKKPNTVPYNYDIQYLAPILHDAGLRAEYDLWMEMEIFGIPYAANTQVEGCEGRSDVFKGTLEFVSRAPGMEDTHGNVLVPIAIKNPEYVGKNLNNYNATDTADTTVKTYTFEVPESVDYGYLVLITSNHGANEGGEEYNRRWHYVYVDDELVLTYKPGRNSCEPFRKYNTQANGIYGLIYMRPVTWQSFSNWCPGDVIDNRIIEMGAVQAGTHTLTIRVPEAVFADRQGDIPLSLYFHGSDTPVVDAAMERLDVALPESSIALTDGILSFESPREDIVSVEIFSVNASRMHYQWMDAPVDMSAYPSGVYLVNIELVNGIIETHKILLTH